MHLFWCQKVKSQYQQSQTTVPAWVTVVLWLSASSSCPCTKDSYRQVIACVERCCTCRLTAAWVRYCMTNFTGSTSPTGCFSSWQWQFIGVWTAVHRRTCRTTVFRPPVSTLGSTCVPPTVNYLQYLTTGSTLTAVGPFQLPAPQSGTLSRISSGTQLSVQTVSFVCLKRTGLLDNSAFSMLEVLDDNCAL